jgi:hypothetical protein
VLVQSRCAAEGVWGVEYLVMDARRLPFKHGAFGGAIDKGTIGGCRCRSLENGKKNEKDSYHFFFWGGISP